MTERDTAQNHYTLLQVKPNASAQEIRQAYRDLSKLYHPDTTTLPSAIATEKFKVLNEAYATLSNPEQRTIYDYSIGISRVAVIQAPAYLNRPASERSQYEKNSAYLDPNDRPLSPGELFALFILGVTFVGCLILVFAIGWTKGEIVFYPSSSDPPTAVPPQPLENPANVPAPKSASESPLLLPSTPQTAPAIESSPNDESSAPTNLPLDNLSPKII